MEAEGHCCPSAAGWPCVLDTQTIGSTPSFDWCLVSQHGRRMQPGWGHPAPGQVQASAKWYLRHQRCLLLWGATPCDFVSWKEDARQQGKKNHSLFLFSSPSFITLFSSSLLLLFLAHICSVPNLTNSTNLQDLGRHRKLWLFFGGHWLPSRLVWS